MAQRSFASLSTSLKSSHMMPSYGHVSDSQRYTHSARPWKDGLGRGFRPYPSTQTASPIPLIESRLELKPPYTTTVVLERQNIN